MNERKWNDIDPRQSVEANLRTFWMNRTFAGPSEKWEHEAEFDRWLAKDRAKTVAEALEEAATAARSMYDPPKAECVEWANWLDARADHIRKEAGIESGDGGS